MTFKVLVLGQTNSGRSQIAEGLLRAAVPVTLEIYCTAARELDSALMIIRPPV